ARSARRGARVRNSPGVCGPRSSSSQTSAVSCGVNLRLPNSVLQKICWYLGTREPKHQQIFCNTEFGSLKFTPQETALVCELLLRGPQTPGELRTRAPRLAERA